MISLYQQVFPFKPVLFTTSPCLIVFSQNYTIDVITVFKTNMYGMPYIKDMMTTISKKYQSLHYGYMNADILFASDLFRALKVVKNQVDQQLIPSPVIVEHSHSLLCST